MDFLDIANAVYYKTGGEVELNGKISSMDEFYLKEFFNRKIIFKRKT